MQSKTIHLRMDLPHAEGVSSPSSAQLRRASLARVLAFHKSDSSRTPSATVACTYAVNTANSHLRTYEPTHSVRRLSHITFPPPLRSSVCGPASGSGVNPCFRQRRRSRASGRSALIRSLRSRTAPLLSGPCGGCHVWLERMNSVERQENYS